jgi:hypothetical protein
MKKREAIKEAIQAWAASSNPETVSHLGSDDAEANELRSELSKKIVASIKARKRRANRIRSLLGEMCVSADGLHVILVWTMSSSDMYRECRSSC